jgi:Glycosyl transferase family 2
MKLVGLMPVRNEAWCLGFTLRVALKWCDEVVVLVHASTDNSERIVWELQEQYPERVHHLGDKSAVWDEMRHRQVLLNIARVSEPTHIAIIDADEFLTPNILPDIRSHVFSLAPGMMMELPGYNIRQCLNQKYSNDGCQRLEPDAGMYYHTNGIWGNRWFATAFKDGPALNWESGGDRFHHREPFGCGWNRWRPLRQGYGGTVHLWGASERRLRAKHALYKITERLRWPTRTVDEIERTYGPATDPNAALARQMNLNRPWTFNALPATWLEPYADLMPYLKVDAEPWQEAEVRLLLEAHGREHFRGLDLLGY